MELHIVLVEGSPQAPYEQVRDQILAMVAAGALPAGTRLPTVRGLADQLGLAANTVAKAYRDLEVAGAVVARGRAGTVVADDDERRAAKAAAADFAARARELGLGTDEAVQLVRAAMER